MRINNKKGANRSAQLGIKMEKMIEPAIFYFNPKEKKAILDFYHALSLLLKPAIENGRDIVLLCIGSDRATGDCLGPIVGYKLSRLTHPSFHVYGTLEHPVHAKNLVEITETIQQIYEDPFIIALDASLGKANHIGLITVGSGGLYPGIGVDKTLPCVGNMHITGIVNLSGFLSQALLQTTRLHVVMRLADFISQGIRYTLSNLYFV